VVFADDSIGVDGEGRPARVARDVVITAIVPARGGGFLVLLRPFVGDQDGSPPGTVA
jgi:hypothetical protein